MTDNTRTFVAADAGCYLDNHRGHYIQRDMIELAIEYGYIVGQFEQFALNMYEDHSHEDSFPYEGMTELADEALDWLNVGDNSGLDRPIKGQNSPPVIPDGFMWGWNDGDFGLYASVLFNIGHEDSNGHSRIAEEVAMPEAQRILKEHGARDDVIERLLAQSPEDMALQAGGFIVEAIDPV